MKRWWNKNIGEMTEWEFYISSLLNIGVLVLVIGLIYLIMK